MPHRGGHRPTLNPNQQRFVAQYTAGPSGIRGNATAAYRAAGYKPTTENAAMVSGWQLLRNPKISAAIAQIHREADAATIAQLRDWKILAPAAQQIVNSLAHGVLPLADTDDPETPLVTRQRLLSRDAPVGNVMLHAALAVLERAYPLKLYADVTVHDAGRVLADILGVSVDALPESSASPRYANTNGHDALNP